MRRFIELPLSAYPSGTGSETLTVDVDDVFAVTHSESMTDRCRIHMKHTTDGAVVLLPYAEVMCRLGLSKENEFTWEGQMVP